MLDGLGTQLDAQTAETFPANVLKSMVIRCPVADA
ncbi:hypothetical protein F4554_005940 [Actinopolymorpha rutila]|uniref:Uncharacterized protein n=1 Tax=Actinopolymorpha rutila TaxID=446787 RepID=A0A852ZP23_9ACTN|nr:hypothetical protein [Actinopolymorpha rutila]